MRSITFIMTVAAALIAGCETLFGPQQLDAFSTETVDVQQSSVSAPLDRNGMRYLRSAIAPNDNAVQVKAPDEDRTFGWLANILRNRSIFFRPKTIQKAYKRHRDTLQPYIDAAKNDKIATQYVDDFIQRRWSVSQLRTKMNIDDKNDEMLKAYSKLIQLHFFATVCIKYPKDLEVYEKLMQEVNEKESVQKLFGRHMDGSIKGDSIRNAYSQSLELHHDIAITVNGFMEKIKKAKLIWRNLNDGNRA